LDLKRTPLRDVIKELEVHAVLPEGQAFPRIELFQVDKSLTLTLQLRHVTLAECLEVIGEIHALKLILDDPEVFILQPASLVNRFETRSYYLDPSRYAHMKDQGGFPELMERWGLAESRNVMAEYDLASGKLLLRMPVDAHNELGQRTLRIQSFSVFDSE